MKEGSFEGQMSGLDFSQDNIISIDALPEQKIEEIPRKIDFKSLPEHIMKSDVIETLIGQNEDMMSRLTVALRRAALLDEKVTDARTESTRYKNKYHNIMDQVLVLREQSRILADRLRGEESKTNKDQRSMQELQEQLQIVEIRYAELYTTFQDRKLKTDIQLEGVNRQINRFRKYRTNIRKAIQSFRNSLNQLHEKRKHYEVSQLNLKNNLDETTAYITQQAKDHRLQLNDLTTSYENQIKNLQSETKMLEQQNNILGERAQEMDRLHNEKVKTENEIIIQNRRIEEMQLMHSSEISDLQKSLGRYRNEANELTVQLDSRQKELALTQNDFRDSSEENKQLNSQVETLQLLWREQQIQVEKMAQQKDSLQKLNKELSVAINEYRKEIRELKESKEAESIKHAEQIKMFDEKLKMINQENQTSLTLDSHEKVAREDLLTPEIITKIDKALSNLHAGR